MTAAERNAPAWTLDDTTGARVGDPVPAARPDVYCSALFGDPAWPWLCIAGPEHAGPHVAGGSDEVYAVESLGVSA